MLVGKFTVDAFNECSRVTGKTKLQPKRIFRRTKGIPSDSMEIKQSSQKNTGNLFLSKITEFFNR